MAKHSYKLKHHKPFTFEGEAGTYEIPPMEKLPWEQLKGVAAVSMNADIDQDIVLAAYKEFFLNVCPELKNEDIGDIQWLQFGNAYFESMGE